MVAVQVQVPREKVKQSSQRGKVHRVGQAREQADKQGDTCLAVRRAEGTVGAVLGSDRDCQQLVDSVSSL